MDASCEQCGERAPSVHYGSGTGQQELCLRCYNAMVADQYGLDFDHADFEPIAMRDASGKEHTFQFEMFHYASGVSLKGFEVREGERGGYLFEVAGEPECEPMELFSRLFQKMQRGLAMQHVEPSDFGLSIKKPDVVRARIDCDLERDERLPLIVVDGYELSWERFGSMLMSYEGFQFRLEVRDMTEEL